MPVQTKRVVVLSTEAFDRLCSSKPPETENQQPDLSDQDTKEDPNEEEETPKIEEPLQVCEAPENCEPTEPSGVEAHFEGTEEQSAEFDPLCGFPVRYLKQARETLAHLRLIPELSWDCQTGCLSVKEHRLALTVTELLRGICVPFTKLRLPLICSQLLTQYHIKPRNHLLVPQPEWHVYFKF